MDANMQSMLGMFDFQKLLEMQQRGELAGVANEAQQAVSVDALPGPAIPAPAAAPSAGGGGGGGDDGMGDIIKLALAFL